MIVRVFCEYENARRKPGVKFEVDPTSYATSSSD
ncbi:hypothetical protein AGR6A_Cc60297 [Agrobacterium sp. NCPPB 925]|nr:hypothetical protein AGR6A_Cc60297 [Agrobacterium sp. NCPPB 925]